MNKIFGFLIAMALLVWGCQSAPKTAAVKPPAVAKTEAPAAPAAEPVAPVAQPATVEPVADPSSIKVSDTGFSPLAQAPHNFLTFTLHVGHQDTAKTWEVDFVASDGTAVRQIKGTAPQFPPAVTWEGKADDGTPAAEGQYIAKLIVDHGDATPEVTQTATVLLDRTPASGSVLITPQLYTPGDPDKLVNPPLLTIALSVKPGIAPVASWRLFIVHPNGSQFMSFISEEHKDNTIVWNGRAPNNASLEAGTTYNVTGQIFDQYGNVGTLKAIFSVAAAAVAVAPGKPEPQVAPVTVTLDGAVIAESKIYFPAYSADLSKVGQEKHEANDKALDALASALKASPGSKIKVIGHANKVFWQDQAKGDAEQKAVLIPLSKARAQAVQAALVNLGLDASEFDLTGVGADGAVAPFGDLVNNWMNRRVEFNVEK